LTFIGTSFLPADRIDEAVARVVANGGQVVQAPYAESKPMGGDGP